MGNNQAKATGSIRVTIEHVWTLLPFALVVWFGFLKRIPLLDFWWHLKSGELIAATWSLPRTDMFSFTCEGKPFVLQNWLMEVLYYAAYLSGGFAAVIVLNTALLVAALAPIARQCRIAAGGVRTGSVVACFAATALLSFGSIRSQVFSFVGFSVFYWVLCEYCDRRRDRLWSLPVVMLAWVNLHGAFVLGLLLGGLFLLCEALRRLVIGAHRRTLSGRALLKLACIVALTLLATLVNPEGGRIYASVVTVLRDPISQSFVTEWQAPHFDRLGILVFYAPFLLTLVGLAYGEEAPRFTDFVLFVVFALLAMAAVRNAIWFALIAMPILARQLRYLDRSGALRWLRRFHAIESLVRSAQGGRRRAGSGAVHSRVNAAIVGAVVMIAILLCPWVRPRLHAAKGGGALWTVDTPVGAMDFISGRGLAGNIFHSEIYGDYLIWRLWPQHRSFVDSRVHLFGQCPELANDYNLIFSDPYWEKRLARYEIRYLLLSKEDDVERPMIEAARGSKNWRMLYEDSESVVFGAT